MNNDELMLDVGQANEIKLAMRREGKWTNKEIKMLCERKGFLTQVHEVLLGRAEIKPIDIVTKVTNFITHTFTVLVDETLSVEEANKRYKLCNVDNITSKNFPKLKDGKKGDREVTIFNFNKDMSSEAVIAKMDKVGYKPATIWDLLGLTVKTDELRRKFSIIALGSVCELHGERYVASLYEDGIINRELRLFEFDSDWHCARFASVRK